MFAAARAFARVISPGVVFGRREGDAATEETTREEGRARTENHVPADVHPEEDAAATVAAANAARNAALDAAAGGEPSRRSGGSAALDPAAHPAPPRAPGARPSDATAGSREDVAATAAGGDVASSGARKRRRSDAVTTERRVVPRTSTRAIDSPCAARRARGTSFREGVSRRDEAEARRLARRVAIAQACHGLKENPAPPPPTTDESAHVFLSIEWKGATRRTSWAPEALTGVRVAVGEKETCAEIVQRVVHLPPGASPDDARIHWGSIVLPVDKPVYGSTIDSTWRADANRPPTLELRVPHGTALRHPDLLRAIGADANLVLGAEYAQGASHGQPRSSVVEKRELHGGGTNPASMVELLLDQKVLSKAADSESVTVVDVGSGDGALARGLQGAFPRACLVGVEVDPGRHAEAVKCHADSGVVFRHGAAEEILPTCLAARVIVGVSRNFGPGTVSAVVRTAAELPCVSHLVLCESTLCTTRCKRQFGPCCCFIRMGSGEVEVEWGNTALGFTVYRRLLPWVVAVDTVPRVDEDGVDVSRLGPLATAFEAEETSDGAEADEADEVEEEEEKAEEADEEEEEAEAEEDYADAYAEADADATRARAEADLARAEADVARAEAHFARAEARLTAARVARSDAMRRFIAATNATGAVVSGADGEDTATGAVDSDSVGEDATDDTDVDGEEDDDEDDDADDDVSGSVDDDDDDAVDVEEEEEDSGSGDDGSESRSGAADAAAATGDDEDTNTDEDDDDDDTRDGSDSSSGSDVGSDIDSVAEIATDDTDADDDDDADADDDDAATADRGDTNTDGDESGDDNDEATRSFADDDHDRRAAAAIDATRASSATALAAVAAGELERGGRTAVAAAARAPPVVSRPAPARAPTPLEDTSARRDALRAYERAVTAGDVDAAWDAAGAYAEAGASPRSGDDFRSSSPGA